MKSFVKISKTDVDAVDGCLVVPVAGQIVPISLERLGQKIIKQVEATLPRGVIINMSSVNIMDLHDFSILRKIVRAVNIMGAPTVIVGVRPGVASSLVDLDIDPGDMLFAATTQDAFDMLENETGQDRLEFIDDGRG